MKKLLLLLAVPMMLFSCQKENIEPNEPVDLGTTVKLTTSSAAPLLYITFNYYDMNGTSHYVLDMDGQIEGVDYSKPFYVEARHGFTLYGPNGTTTTSAEGNYYLYVDDVNVDVKNNVSYYNYYN